MAELTLREAAKLLGLSRQSVYRDVQAGRVSATTRHEGDKVVKVVDTTELERHYGRLGPKPRPDLTAITAEATAEKLPDTTELVLLRAKLEASQEALARADQQLVDMRAHLATVTMLLQVKETSSGDTLRQGDNTLKPKENPGFWARAFGKRVD